MQLDEIRKMYEAGYQKISTMEDKDMKEANSIHNLIKYAAKDPFEDLRKLIVSEMDKEMYKSATEINKEYIEKYYILAKPGIEKYWNFTPEFLNSLDNAKILEKFNKCKELINKEKNSDHSEDHKSFQIKIIKTFPYYINKELEDRMDAKCRKAYYEIMAM